MNAKQFIESGSLELYVMDSLPADETKQINELRKHDKEINDEILRIENALEEFAFSQQREPKPELKQEIARRIGFGVELDLEEQSVKSIILHLRPAMRLAAAAAILLVVGLSVSTIYFMNKLSGANKELMALKSEQSILANQVKFSTTKANQLKSQLANVSDPGQKQILLNGLPISPASKAVIFWNKETGHTFINSSALAAVASNEQYKLWAIVDGKPVDLGVLSKQTNFAAMKDVKNAVAFAITLEPLGGKESPTMDKMYVLGNV